jgi:hypothetical protein
MSSSGEELASLNAALSAQFAASARKSVQTLLSLRSQLLRLSMPLRFVGWDGAADKVSGKHKVAVQRNGHFAASVARTGTLCWLSLQMTSNHADLRLNPQKAPCYTEGAECHTQQHYGRAAVRNPRTARPEERPMGESILAEEERDRDYPSQTLDVPNLRTSVWTVVLGKQVCKTARAKIYNITATVILGIKDGSGTSTARRIPAKVVVPIDT